MNLTDTAPPTPDIPLLRKVVEWVEVEDQRPAAECEWEQGAWIIGDLYERARRLGEPISLTTVSCGTKACACGHIASLNGATLTVRGGVIAFDGLSPEEYGARALGVHYEQALDLFHATNTAADVRRVAEDIAGERL